MTLINILPFSVLFGSFLFISLLVTIFLFFLILKKENSLFFKDVILFFIFLGEILAKSSTKIQAICHCRAFLNAANVVAKLLRNDVFSLFLTTWLFLLFERHNFFNNNFFWASLYWDNYFKLHGALLSAAVVAVLLGYVLDKLRIRY